MDSIPEDTANRHPTAALGQVVVSTADGRAWTRMTWSVETDLERIRLGELALPTTLLPLLVSAGPLDAARCSDDGWLTIVNCLNRWLEPDELRAIGFAVRSVTVIVRPNRHRRRATRRHQDRPAM
jgi:hypothetical protein